MEITEKLEAKRQIKAIVPKNNANPTVQKKQPIPVKVEKEPEEEDEKEEIEIPYLETEKKLKVKLSKKFENYEVSLNDVFNQGLTMFFDIKEVNCDRKKKILEFVIQVNIDLFRT